jgi:hypothetical protein
MNRSGGHFASNAVSLVRARFGDDLEAGLFELAEGAQCPSVVSRVRLIELMQ